MTTRSLSMQALDLLGNSHLETSAHGGSYCGDLDAGNLRRCIRCKNIKEVARGLRHRMLTSVFARQPFMGLYVSNLGGV